MIEIGREVCADYRSASSREWLETNGLGGYSCGTIAGSNTRRYHSYLTAATKPPLGRITLVSKIEETLIVNNKANELSSNQFPGTVHPEGYKYLESFRLDPFPTWIYAVGDVRLEKKLFMVHGSNMTVCQWKLLTPGMDAVLKARPMLSFVDYHQIRLESAGTIFHTNVEDLECVRVSAGGVDAYFGNNAGGIDITGYWYKNFELQIERERGFDFREDLFQPFELTYDLAQSAVLILSTEPLTSVDALKLEKSEISRRKTLIKTAKVRSDFGRELVLAADQFVVRRGEGHTVIAGYPWFSDWGRDTMISLPGLTLATGRPEIARQILKEFSKHVSNGMLPNRFADADGEAEYNTVDGTLWYFEAVRAYLERTRDFGFVQSDIYPALIDIILWHIRGTRYGIKVDESDGLLRAGEEGVQLTWMDAKVGGMVITPRTGKAVEIQALWYNTLRVMAGLAKRFGDAADSKKYSEMAERCRASFEKKFWNEKENCLFDVVADHQKDGSVRPNQIFAASLYFPIIEGDKARAVVNKCEQELLTPYGLRSLSPNDSRYVPVYTGSPFERDSAYHQGTVWAWLIGGFIDAYRRVYADRKQQVEDFLTGFRQHLYDAGVGQISEIFDAQSPFLPRGCFAQAWSVAEVLRALKSQE